MRVKRMDMMRELSMEETIAVIDGIVEMTQAIIYALRDVDENETEYAFIISEED